MKAKHLLLLSLVLLTLYREGQAQQATRRVCDTIPYEIIHHKIIIPVTVNGVRVKYIVDTGGQTGTMRENAIEMQATAGAGSRAVSDVNGMNLSYQEAVLQDVQLSPNYTVAQMNTMIFPTNGFFRDLGVVGILGSDAFTQAVVTFDARRQIMVINYPYRPGGLKITDGIPFHPGGGGRPVIDVDFGGITRPVLFDTGHHGLLSLSDDDYKHFIPAASRSLASAHGVNFVGIGGFDYKNATAIEKVSINQLNFAGKRFSNVATTTIKMGMSLVGVDILQHGKVTIDYMRKRFYFFPYDDTVEDLTGHLKTWNVAILPVNGRFEITTVWDSLRDRVSLGDQVLSINGHDLSGLKQSQLEIEALLDAVEGDRASIVILKDGKEQTIEITKSE